MDINIEKHLNKKVSQANDFIESPFTQEFTASELKIFEGSISQCVQDDLDLYHNKKNKEVKFTTNQLATLLRTSSSSVSHEAERIAKSLVTKHIHARRVLDNNQVEFVTIAILPFARYYNGVFELELNYKLIPYFIAIDRPYTQFYLHNISALKSSYAIKLYKLLYQYKNIKFRKFNIEELRKQFGINDSKYPRYSDFKKNVIDLPISQINENTDLNVAYSEIKFGRKVEVIEFKFNLKKGELIKNELTESIEIESSINKCDEVEMLLGNKSDDVSDKTKLILNKLIPKKGLVFVECSINYAKKNAKSNFEKYLLDTIGNNWAEVEIQKLESKRQAEEIDKQKKQAKLDAKNKELELENANKSEIEHLFIKLTDSEQLKYTDLANNILSKDAAKLKHITVEALSYSIFAVSNGKYYDRKSEVFISKFLKRSLNVNDYMK